MYQRIYEDTNPANCRYQGQGGGSKVSTKTEMKS